MFGEEHVCPILNFIYSDLSRDKTGQFLVMFRFSRADKSLQDFKWIYTTSAALDRAFNKVTSNLTTLASIFSLIMSKK